MTSPKFKLRNYWFFWNSTFMRYNALEHLNTFIYTTFWFERVLHFVIEDAWISRLLHDSAFSWQWGKILRVFKTLLIFEILISEHSLSQNRYYFNLCEFLKQWIHAFVEKLKNRCFCWFSVAIFVPLKGTLTWRLHTKLSKLIILGKTFFHISCIWNITQT